MMTQMKSQHCFSVILLTGLVMYPLKCDQNRKKETMLTSSEYLFCSKAKDLNCLSSQCLCYKT